MAKAWLQGLLLSLQPQIISLSGVPVSLFSLETKVIPQTFSAKKSQHCLLFPSKPEIQKSSPVINFEFPSNSRFLDNQSNAINLDNQSAPAVIGKILKALENINKLQAELSVGEPYNNQIAKQLVEMADLDIGMVLLLTNDKWVISGCYTANENVSVRYSTTLVKNVVEQKNLLSGFIQPRRKRSVFGKSGGCSHFAYFGCS